MNESSANRHRAVHAAVYRRHLVARGHAVLTSTPGIDVRVRAAAVAAAALAAVAAVVLL